MGGELPLSAHELHAWATGCKVSLTPWEFETVLAGSHAYVSSKAAAAEPDCPAPWAQLPSDAARPKIAKNIKALLRSK